jgi:hypothetical protein
LSRTTTSTLVLKARGDETVTVTRSSFVLDEHAAEAPESSRYTIGAGEVTE